MKGRLIGVAGVALALVLTAPAQAQQRFCGGSNRACTRVVVPLDRSGAVPGEISLLVERQRPRRAPTRPPLFLIAGGPGQSATLGFDRETVSEMLGRVARQREVIVVDLRGTGGSGALRCREAERASPRDERAAAAACARQLGPARSLYTTAASVDDLDRVRRAFGYDRIALLGASYGTKVALAYAARYPQRVERMVLDSVVDDRGPGPFAQETLTAIPRVLRAACGRHCRSFTADPARDLARLAARVGRSPMPGYVVDSHGRRRPSSLTRRGLFSVVSAGDFDPDTRAELAGAVASTRRGDPAPLLRLQRRAEQLDEASFRNPRMLSAGAFLAARCQEGPFPWDPAASPATREAQALAAARALPAGAFGPFDAGAGLAASDLDLCLDWPDAGGSAPPSGPLPSVPSLLLSGEQDLRTPTEVARALLRRLPGSRLLVVPNAGHAVAGSSSCVDEGIQRFLAGGTPPGICGGDDLPGPVPPPPLGLRDLRPVRGVPGRPGRALAAVNATLRDSSRELLFVLENLLSTVFEDPSHIRRLPDIAVGGLRGGRFRIGFERRPGTVSLRRLSYVPGVRITGRFGPRGGGTLRVGGPGTPDGVLHVNRRGVASGRIGTRRVRTKLGGINVDAMDSARAAAARRLVVPWPR